MTAVSGHLSKMETEAGNPVNYSLPLDQLSLPLNPFLGRKLSLRFTGAIHCIACGRKIPKSYSQGYCFPCTRVLAECDFCILKPEQCHYHKGTCRQPDWGLAHCFQPHYVYLANSSGLKVGITRNVNIPTRWIDQGACQALPILRVASRFQSGLLEVLFKDHVADKTNWRQMLQECPRNLDLPAHRDRLLAACAGGIAALQDRFGADAIVCLENEPVVELEYPVHRYPERVTSLNFDKTPVIEGVLHGIKGQYLILDKGVLNIRKFTGYEVAVDA